MKHSIRPPNACFCIPPMKSSDKTLAFSALKLHPTLLRGVETLKFTRPTPIQSEAIPHALEGRDLLACAATGSGKTAAFLLPILHQLVDRPRGTTRALVLAPTRELARQILDDLNDLARYTGVTGAVVHGGVGMGPQTTAFRKGADVIIATPGRLLDHFQYDYASLSGLEYLVLDEADRADPNVLAVLNQAIANKRMPLPTRFEKPFAIMHPDFRIMCAGNTAGTGADRLYTAATRLDEAFLDRFRAGTLFMDYDAKLERDLVGDTLLIKCMHRMRDKAKTLRIERVISTRVICDLHDLFDGTSTKDTKLALKRLQGTWEPAEVAKIDPKVIMQEVAA